MHLNASTGFMNIIKSRLFLYNSSHLGLLEEKSLTKGWVLTSHSNVENKREACCLLGRFEGCKVISKTDGEEASVTDCT